MWLLYHKTPTVSRENSRFLTENSIRISKSPTPKNGCFFQFPVFFASNALFVRPKIKNGFFWFSLCEATPLAGGLARARALVCVRIRICILYRIRIRIRMACVRIAMACVCIAMACVCIDEKCNGIPGACTRTASPFAKVLWQTCCFSDRKGAASFRCRSRILRCDRRSYLR